MKTITFAVLLCLSANVDALDIEMGVGQAFAQKAEDGIWYQDRFPHAIRLQGEFQTELSVSIRVPL